MIVMQLVVLIVSIVIHEVAHGVTAYRLGDPTAKSLGRLSLNPIKHVDPLGTVLLPGLLIVTGAPFLFGWAKPVPVSPRYFMDPLKGMMFVALAGPLSNVTLAVLFSGVLYLVSFGLFSISAEMSLILMQFCLIGITINFVLALFNMMPIPPLDGSRVLAYFSPPSFRELLNRVEPYGLLLVFVAVYFDVFHTILKWLAPFVLSLLVPQNLLGFLHTSFVLCTSIV